MRSEALANLLDDRASRFQPGLYDALYAQFSDYNDALARICAAMVPCPKGGSILELGSGTGLFASAILNVFDPSNFIGIDPSPSMTEAASRRLPSGRTQLVCDTAQHLRTHIPPASVDAIFVKSAFHHFQDVVSFDELLGSLNANGRLVIIERTERSAGSYPIFDEARDYWQAFFRRQSSKTPVGALSAECTYGEYVRVTAREYYHAIEAGQLSFIWSFDETLVSTWVRRVTTPMPDFVDVYEEFQIRVFSKTSQ